MYVDFVAQIACKSALTVLLLGRRVFASQRVLVCLPATLVDSSSFCFATCVCQSACDSSRLGSTRSCVDRRSELVEPASRWRVARKSVARRLQNRSPSASQSSLWRSKNRCLFDRCLDLKRKRRFCKNKRFVSTGARFLRFRKLEK